MAQSPPAEVRFRRLYDGHLDQLRRYFSRRLPACDVDDATAEVFLVAWRRIRDVPRDGTTVLWLYGIARNVVRNHERTSRRRLRLGARLRTSAVAHHPTDPADSAIGLQQHHHVLECLSSLSARDQEVLRLAAWEGLRAAEIGEVLRIRPHTASIRLSRARNRLARAMQQAAIPIPTPRAVVPSERGAGS